MIQPQSLLLFLGLFTWSLSASSAAKVIAVPPIMFESHLYIFKTLATALQKEGHETHFLISEGREVPPSPDYSLQHYPGIFNSSTADSFLQSKVSNIFSGRLTFLELFDILDHYSQNCDAVVGNVEVITRLKEAKFDLLLVDPNEMCGFVIAHILGVQYAVLSTGLWYPAEVGAPAPLSYVPEFNSLLTDHMTLGQRITNTVVYLVQRFGVNYIVLPQYDRIMKKHGVKPQVAMADLVQGSRLWMLCTDMALEFPRPTLPHVVYIGGILTKPPNPLPQVSTERYARFRHIMRLAKNKPDKIIFFMIIVSSHAQEGLCFVLCFVYCASLDWLWSKSGLSQYMQILILKKYCVNIFSITFSSKSNEKFLWLIVQI